MTTPNDPTPCPNPRCSGTLALVLTASNGPVLVCHTCWWMEPTTEEAAREASVGEDES